VRTAYALRPEGIQWPLNEEGMVTLKLERLTEANGLEHGQAHDALSDVRATIAMARLVRQRQPKLYDFLYRLRGKHAVLDQVQLLKPLVHVSGRFSAARSFLSLVLPLAWHPRNRNALIVCDLGLDPAPLLELDAEALRQRLYTRREELGEGELPVPLKLVHVNRCPVLAPLAVLREQDQARLGIDLAAWRERERLLVEGKPLWQDKLAAIYAQENFAGSEDPEQQLYDGFIGDRDRRLCEQVRQADPVRLGREQWPFDDPRLVELLFRYRARNFPETLSAAEQEQWREFCRCRLMLDEYGAPNTLANFEVALAEQLENTGLQGRALLQEWQAYAAVLRQRYCL